MGEARRRKLAGDPPNGPKRNKPVRAKRRDLIDEMIGVNAMVTALGMMMGARLGSGTRHLPKAFESNE